MVKVDKVWGSKEQAKPVVIIGDNVYLHTNVTLEEEGLYTYTEYQLSLSEFLTTVFSLSGIGIIDVIDRLEVKS